MRQVKDLEMGSLSNIGGGLSNTKVLIRGKEEIRTNTGDVKTEARGWSDAGEVTSQGMQVASGSQKKKPGNDFFPLVSKRNQR